MIRATGFTLAFLLCTGTLSAQVTAAATPLDAPIQSIRDIYEAEVLRANAAEARIAELEGQIILYQARIKELEAQVAGDPPPDTSSPAILDERFPSGVDWTRFFSDGNPAAPPERFVVVPGGLKVIWICGSPTGTARTELGIRNVVGGGETPRRDPVGSERYYLHEFIIPSEYKLADAEADHKRVLWQAHQVSGSNPPLSLELRNGTLRVVSVVNGYRRELLPRLPAPKGRPIRLFMHILWHPTNGYIDVTLDGLHVLYKGGTCNAVSDGMNVKCGSYQPGASLGEFPTGYRVEHVIVRHAIGDETDSPAEFE